MKKVLVVGSEGNMGRRYSAILRHLGIEVLGLDVDRLASMSQILSCDGAIIATPTNNHAEQIRKMKRYGFTVLCEKPIARSFSEVEECIEKYAGPDFQMINQYRHLVPLGTVGDTDFDYYNHGKDGIHWDCINIIGLSWGKISLGEKSPRWHCVINGHKLNISGMDHAYVREVQQWLEGPKNNKSYILQAHRKVEELINETQHVDKSAGLNSTGGTNKLETPW